MNSRKAVAMAIALLTVLATARAVLAQTGVQFTKDGKRTLITKNVGTERWAITYNLDDLTVTGNVFFPDGRDPAFVWCERTPTSEHDVTLSCYGADKCVGAPCPSTQWTSLAQVVLPLDFFFPPGAIPALEIYTENGSAQNNFIPSGFMGDHGAITLDTGNTTQPHSGSTCAKFTYTGEQTQGQGWAGVYWQHPENNFGSQLGRTDVAPRERVSFWARGEVGGEKVRFGSGGINRPQQDGLPFQDSFGPVCLADCMAPAATIALSTDWQHYVINLRDQNVSMVIGAFFWVATKVDNPTGATFCLDDIVFE